MITISGMTRQFGLANSFASKYGATSTTGKSKDASELATTMASLGQKLEEARASKSAAASGASEASSSSSGAEAADALSEHEAAMSEAIARIKENLSSRISSSTDSPTYSRPTVKSSSSASGASQSSPADSLLSAVQKKGERDLMNAKVLSTVHASGIGAIKGSYTVTVDPSSSKVSVAASGEGSSSEQAKAIEDALNDAGMSSTLYSHIKVSAQGQDNTQLDGASGDGGDGALSISLSSDGLHDIGQENGYGNGDTAWIQKLQAGI